MSELETELRLQLKEVNSRLRIWRAGTVTALVAAIIALLLSGFTAQTAYSALFVDASPSPCPTPTAGPTGQTGATGKTGLSAYDLWLQLGHQGTPQQFLDSLVGEKGDDGVYIGSNGLNGTVGAAGATGAAGQDGESAFETWLKSNPGKTEAEFLASLVGPQGTAGIGGLSAYELWLVSNPGKTVEEFVDQLTGTNGTDGLNGESAYEIWLKDSANAGKSEAEFIASLKGQQGDAGICTNGTNGSNGSNGSNGLDGLSAYQLWLLQPNNSGTVDTFLASLIGPKGDQGEQGSQGLPGEKGPKGDTGAPGATGGYYLALQDKTTQNALNPDAVNPMNFDTTDANNGFTVNRSGGHTVITFLHSGAYFIQYSVQWVNTSTSKEYDANVYLNVDGSPMADTSTYTTVGQQHSNRDGKLVTTVNYLIEFRAGQTLEFYWWAEHPDVSIATIPNPGNSFPAMPASPGIIMSINQVG